ncbi:MAG: hypothetical protein R3C44_15820 [Chloroflexota bacterium]
MQSIRQMRTLWPAAVLIALLALAGASLAVSTSAQADPTVQTATDTAAVALGTSFSFQGQIADVDGVPFDGQCDLIFELYDAPTGGTKLGEVSKPDLPVSGGLFAAQLDFGANAFKGDARWINILVRCPAGIGNYELLPVRHELSAVPYAVGLRPGAQIEGSCRAAGPTRPG